MKILVFSAHVADFCSRSGGTIAKHSARGDTVRVVVLSGGERSESGGLYAGGAKPPLNDIKEIRRNEAVCAASILGAELRCLDWDDLLFPDLPGQIVQLAEEIRSFGPDVIVTHHGPDPVSADHEKTWRLATRAAQYAAAPGLESEYPGVPRTRLFLFEATVPLTEQEGFKPDFYVDITETWGIKAQALRAFHRSQPFLESWYTDIAELRASQARFLCGRNSIQYAEAFEWTMPSVNDFLP